MASNAWKNFINESLTEFENVQNSNNDVEESYENPPPFDFDQLKNDKKSWCNSIDRSFGYAFRSFCRFVISKTLNESSILKTAEIGPNNFRDVIDRNFRYTQLIPPDPLPNYYRSYPRYARWHNLYVRNRKLCRIRRGCNLSYFRFIRSSRPRSRETGPKTTTVELGRYQVVKPVNTFPSASLSMVFE